jgi:hypothetical protein
MSRAIGRLIAVLLAACSPVVGQKLPEGVACLPGHQLCTPNRAVVQKTGAGKYHVILPANLEWGVSIPNPKQEATILNAAGRICWDPELRESHGCNGPEGCGVVPKGNFGRPEDFLAPEKPAGALIMKSVDGRT